MILKLTELVQVICSRYVLRLLMGRRSSRNNRKRLELVKHPHKALTQRADVVTVFDKELQSLAHDMFHICRTNNIRGAGLGANQVAVLKRVIVVNCPDLKTAMVNPKIMEFSKKTDIKEEGCLSHPGKKVEIERSVSVTVSFQDLDGAAQACILSSFVARVVQHEIEHLDGINIIDYEINIIDYE